MRKNVKMRKWEKGKKRWNRKKRENFLKWEKRESVKKSPSPSLSLAKLGKSEKFSRVSQNHPPNPPTTSLFLFLSLSQNFFKQKKKFLAARPKKNEGKKKKKTRIVSASLFFAAPTPPPQKKKLPHLPFQIPSEFPLPFMGFSNVGFLFLILSIFRPAPSAIYGFAPPPLLPPATLLVSHPFVCLSPVPLLPLSLLPCHLVWVCLCLCFGRCLCLAHPPTHHVSLSLSQIFSKKKTERENERNEETKKCEKEKKEKTWKQKKRKKKRRENEKMWENEKKEKKGEIEKRESVKMRTRKNVK